MVKWGGRDDQRVRGAWERENGKKGKSENVIE